MNEMSYPNGPIHQSEEETHGGPSTNPDSAGDSGGGSGDLGGQGQGEEDNNGDAKPNHDTGTE